jgi:hypothetical protein
VSVVTPEALDDYLARHMPDDEAEAFEEALFDAAAEGEVRFADRLARLGRRLHELRLFEHKFTRRDYDRLSAAGVRIELRDAGPPGPTDNYPPGDVDMVVVRVPLELDGLRQVDVEFEVPGVGVIKTLRDLEVDEEEGALYLACDVNLMRTTLGLPRVLNRVVGVRDGRREELALYDVRVAPE